MTQKYDANWCRKNVTQTDSHKIDANWCRKNMTQNGAVKI
jgi:hypothetical protein